MVKYTEEPGRYWGFSRAHQNVLTETGIADLSEVHLGKDDPVMEYLWPADSTRVEPPTDLGEGQWPAFDPEKEEWYAVPDHRGETWYDQFEIAHQVFFPGDPAKFVEPLHKDQILPSLPANPLGASIRDWQFFTQLALEGVITPEEAEATSSGELPQLLKDAAATIEDPSVRLLATMKVKNALDFFRNDNMVELVAQYLNALGTFGTWDAARLDKLWEDAAKLG